MRRPPPSFDAALRAFRQTTASPADGRVTRARLLAATARQLRRRRLRRRALGLVPAVLVFLSLGTAAWTAALRFRAPPPAAMDIGAPVAGAAAITAGYLHPRRSIPATTTSIATTTTTTTATADDGDPWSAESRAYGRAHRAHFVDDDPARALAGWGAYLREFPDGTFAPEARFNRALCLIRLRRFEESARALRAFVRASSDARLRNRSAGYRHADACALLRWLGTVAAVAGAGDGPPPDARRD